MAPRPSARLSASCATPLAATALTNFVAVGVQVVDSTGDMPD
jgi:hypothetical protein